MERDYFSLDKRYPRLFVPSEFSKVSVGLSSNHFLVLSGVQNDCISHYIYIYISGCSELAETKAYAFYAYGCEVNYSAFLFSFCESVDFNHSQAIRIDLKIWSFCIPCRVRILELQTFCKCGFTYVFIISSYKCL